jgi:hypothetical protein
VYLALQNIGGKELIHEFNLPQEEKRKGTWGTVIVDDFLAFYFCKKLGVEAAQHLCGEIPPAVVELSSRLSLNFYERVLPDAISVGATDEMSAYFEKLSAAGILPWTNEDREEFRQVADVMKEFYPVGRRRNL